MHPAGEIKNFRLRGAGTPHGIGYGQTFMPGPRVVAIREAILAADSHPELVALTQCPDGEIDLARAALLLAAPAYPGLAVEPYLARLDALAAAVRARLGADTDPRRAVAGINRQLFEVEGFRGNEAAYDDPRNSYLNEVLDRKLGIPITLSVVFLEVAWRLGVPAEGVGLPGHFLVRVPGEGGGVLLDPFHGGAEITPGECQALLDGLSGGLVRLEGRMLAPVTKRQILVRILRNLKATFLAHGDYDRVLEVVASILVLDPASAADLRDRGLLYYRQHRFPEALADLRKSLLLAHGADDREQVARAVRGIEAILSVMR